MSKVVSTAAQFFGGSEDEKSVDISERIVALLNEAAVTTKEQHKVQNLKTVQELITQRDTALLDNFLDEVLSFKNDKSIDVKRFLISFMEIACEKDPCLLTKVAANVQLMLNEENPNIRKRAIRAASQLYKICFKWISSSKSNLDFDDSKRNTWNYFQQIKDLIVSYLESYNDGIRTLVVKFMETVIVCQTFPDSESPSGGLSLDDIPTHVGLVLKLSSLEEQARKMLDMLIAFHGTQHISSVNLMACTQSLVIIARTRAEFLARVIPALEMLHANLPPTLSNSQVSSVRKHLKSQLFVLCKHPSATYHSSKLATLLTDLGATTQELSRYLPRGFSAENQQCQKKRAASVESLTTRKMARISIPPDEEDMDQDEHGPASDTTDFAIDITAKELVPLLTTTNVTDVVLVSMLKLPDIMPANFQATYTPISVAGTEQQINHLSRLMATQMTASNVGKGVELLMKRSKPEKKPMVSEKNTIETIGRKAPTEKPMNVDTEPLLIPSGSEAVKTRTRQLTLSRTTKVLKGKDIEQISASTVKRLYRAGITEHRTARRETIATIAVENRAGIASQIRNFVFQEANLDADFLLSWLFQEYSLGQKADHDCSPEYEKCLQEILLDLLIKVETKDRDTIFQTIFLESPLLTGSAMDILKQYCQSELSVIHGLNVLRMLIEYRPLMRTASLDLLLQLTVNQMGEVRQKAIDQCIILCDGSEQLRNLILEHAISNLESILRPAPPQNVHPNQQESGNVWLEDDIKLCLALFLGLMPKCPSLVHDLARVYVEAAPDIKRIILWTLDQPIKAIGMNSPEVLDLLDRFPDGAETLLTRILHLLTEQSPPSSGLVSRVRALYHDRVSDVRILIPVLPGLSRQEVVAALPKLIKLNTNVVKEVFSRILNCGENGPLSAAELMTALHNIDSSCCDVKTVMKATSLCFAEKSTYTQDILALVLQQLMEQTPLPTLFMRTAIQSLTLYPRLLGFIMNVLQRLIARQVWNQKKVWEGFIKCCERAQPQSFNVIIQLPPEPLRELLESAPALRAPLLQHMNSLTQHQKSHIAPDVLAVLLPGDDAQQLTV